MNQNYDIIPIPISIRGADGKYIYVNQAWCEMFSLRVENILGYTDKDLNLGPLALPDGEPGALIGEYSFRDVVISTKDKGRLLLELIESRIDEPKSQSKILCVHQDMTGIGWRMEDMSRNLHRSEIRVRESVQYVHKIIQDTGEVLKQTVSYCDKLDGTKLDLKQRGMLAIIRDNVRNLQRSVRAENDTRVFSDENGGVGDESVLIAPLVGEVVRLYENLARDRNVSIVTQLSEELSQPVFIDRGHVRQILVSMIESAICSSNAGRILFSVSMIQGSYTPLFFKVVMENPVRDIGNTDGQSKGMHYNLSHKLLRGLCAAIGGRLEIDRGKDGMVTFRVFLRVSSESRNGMQL